MLVESSTRPSVKLGPLAYHRELCDYLRQEEAAVWNWFASHKVRDSQAEQVRFELLKSTYRLDRQAHPALYDAVDEAARALEIGTPVTLYQAQNPLGLNASMAFTPHEVQIVLHGPIESQLSPQELAALLGHELCHHWFFEGGQNEFLIADQVLAALTNDTQAHPVHLASARLWRMYTEILCDRASMLVAGDVDVAVSMLLKVHTGLQQVCPASFLKQAEEIFARQAAATDGLTHPEAYVRARAIKLWAEGEPVADAAIAAMIEGRPALDALDLLSQRRVAEWTRSTLQALLKPDWFRTTATLAHARLYFADFAVEALAESASAKRPTVRMRKPPCAVTKAADAREASRQAAPEPEDAAAWQPSSGAVSSAVEDGVPLLGAEHATLHDYFSFVLLDFVTADRDLEEMPLAAALALSERMQIKPRFVELARQELRLRKNQLEKIDQQKEQLLAGAEQEATTSAAR